MSDKNQTSDLPDAHRGRMDVSPSDDSAVEHREEPYVCDQVKTEEDEVPINTSTECLEETPGLLNVKEETDDMSSHQTEIHCFLPADVDDADIVKVEITEDLLEALDEESSDSTSPDVSVSLDIPSQCQTADTFSGIFNNRRSRIGKKSLSSSENGKVMHKDLNLIAHQKKNTREKAFSCPECGKEFAMKSRLIRHQKSHTGEKAFSCSDCGKSFTLKLSLVRHQNIHTKEKAFICSICGKSFTQKSSLITHQNIHTGEKTFLCPECGKCFTRKSNLIRHQTMHTGEKPFLCFECGKRFIWKTSLISHQKIHTGEKVIL